MAEYTPELKFFSRKVTGVILTAVVIFLIIVGGVGLPMPISPQTKDFYNEIMALQPGDKVVMASDHGMAGYTSRFYTNYDAVIVSVARRNVKMIMLACGVALDTPAVWVDVITKVGLEKKYGYVYGRDYVILPFMAGIESAMRAIADNFYVFKEDIFGNSLDTLPLMQEAKSMRDCKLVVGQINGIDHVQMMVRQWGEAYGIRMIMVGLWGGMSPFYGKYIFGVLDGSLGCAEYQKLVGVGGEELMKIDARNIGLAFSSVLIVAANIIYWRNRLRRKV